MSSFWPRVVFKGEKFSDAVSAHMRLSRVELNVYLNANLPSVSQSTMTMTFMNDHNQVLEGELMFNLPKNSTVCGYGVDINGEMVDAVPVAKEKAKVVFEDEVRKRTTATPAIAEMVTGDTFKTRIYPLPRNGSRTVRLSYETRIPLGSNSSFRHHIPATISKGVKELTVRCHCVGFHRDTPPEHYRVGSGPGGKGSTHFDFKWHNGDAPGAPGKFIGEMTGTPLWGRGQRRALVADIHVVLPFNGSACAIESDIENDRKEDEVGAYFCICDNMVSKLHATDALLTPTQDESKGQTGDGQPGEGQQCEGQQSEGQSGEGKPGEGKPGEGLQGIGQPEEGQPGEGQLGEGQPGEGQPDEGQQGPSDVEEKSRTDKLDDVRDQAPGKAIAPTRVGVIWDCSLSRNVPKAREHDLRALRALLEQEAWSDTKVSMIGLRNVWGRAVELSRDEEVGWDGLYDVLNKTTYDGATNLSAANFEERWSEDQETPFDFILLFSDGLATIGREIPPEAKVPVYAINFGSSGGRNNHDLLRFISDKSGGKYFDMTSSVDAEAGVAELTRQIGRPTMRFLGAEYDKSLMSLITPIRDNDAFMVSGTLSAEEATLILKYRYTTDKPVLLREFKLRMCDAAPSGGIVRRQWARQRMSEMLPLPTKYKEELEELGKKFSILTPGTSFIVLETIQQHLEHKIAPHPSRKDLREQYDAQMEGRRLETKDNLQQKIMQVSRYVRNRESWYRQDFKQERERAKNGAMRIASRRQLNHRSEDGLIVGDFADSEYESSDDCAGGGLFGDSDSDSDCGRSYSARRSARGAVSSEYAPTSFQPSASKRRAQSQQAAPPPSSSAPSSPATDSISVRAWDPNTPYMTQIRNMKTKQPAYLEYLKLRPQYETSPSFYFDVSSLFETKFKSKSLAARILSNVLELNLENAQVLRTVGYKLLEFGNSDGAAGAFESVKRLCPDEPQSYRDLALALLDKKSKVYDPSRALRLLDEAVTGTWHARFHEIELTCLMELAHAIDAHGFDRATLSTKPGLRTPSNILKKFDVDLRIVLGWDTDMTDVDLHVIEPTGEECYYGNRRTRIGGNLSRDFTGGFGPEEYLMKTAYPGKYLIRAKYFASHRQSLTGATTLLLAIFKHYGNKRKEERKFISVRLSANKQLLQIGDVTFQTAFQKLRRN